MDGTLGGWNERNSFSAAVTGAEERQQMAIQTAIALLN